MHGRKNIKAQFIYAWFSTTRTLCPLMEGCWHFDRI